MARNNAEPAVVTALKESVEAAAKELQNLRDQLQDAQNEIDHLETRNDSRFERLMDEHREALGKAQEDTRRLDILLRALGMDRRQLDAVDSQIEFRGLAALREALA